MLIFLSFDLFSLHAVLTHFVVDQLFVEISLVFRLKMKNLSLVLILLSFHVTYGHYQGPFLLWGLEDLNSMRIPALQGEKLEICF